jgi:hypothetical protein
VDGIYDKTSWRVLDHETKFANLTESNNSKEIRWLPEYTAKVFLFYTSNSNIKVLIFLEYLCIE